MKRLRLAAVSFLNARPITYGIEKGLVGGDRFELRLDLPSRCAAAVASGDADLALMPLAAYAASDQDLRIVPGISVASYGDVRTVVLAGQVPWEELTEIALDGASRTSQMLSRLLTKNRGLSPTFIETPHDHIVDAVEGTRGALIIGDAGLGIEGRFPYLYDLGGQWLDRVGLPFVYAVWAGRADAVTPDDVVLFQESLRLGLANRDQIARDFAAESGLPADLCERYLRDHIRYGLGAYEISGADAFLARSHEAGLLPRRRSVRLYVSQPAARPARSSRSLDSLLSDGSAGRALSFDEGLRLYNEASLMDLGQAADARRQALHPSGVVTYIIDRNVNYTNACVTCCQFCNFYRPPGHADAYTLSRPVLAQKLQETLDLGGVQVLLQGGINPELSLGYYEDLFRFMKAEFPRIAIHGLSPEEIRYLSEREQLSIPVVLERLIAAGLDSVPGGAAEILDDEIRQRVSPHKCSAATWIEVMRQAHRLGLRTTATMVFGFGEEAHHVLGHMDKVRSLQDETSGFTAFICWAFQAEGTKLPLRDDTGALRYLRVLSLARLYLDNVPNLQVSWVTMGPAVGQVGLRFGGNDFGSAMIEENVVASAGTVFKVSAGDIEKYVRQAGFTPRRRNMRYELID
jgi:cyclic dehypoxanthinyl futalosine synthase